jgi:hypothetical protein
MSLHMALMRHNVLDANVTLRVDTNQIVRFSFQHNYHIDNYYTKYLIWCDIVVGVPC